jgi:hypothetical protein
MRTKVKLAASMLVCLNASRHSSELPANAVIAISVRTKTRVAVTVFYFRESYTELLAQIRAERQRHS